jgi:hypothetical protein
VTNGLPQFGPCVIRVSGAGPSRARAIWGLERRAEWMRRKQPEVEPYCACESCACCGSVAVRRVGARAWPGGPWAAGAGLCEGRAGCGPVRGEGRANAGPGAGQCEARAGPLLAGSVRAAGRGGAW